MNQASDEQRRQVLFLAPPERAVAVFHSAALSLVDVAVLHGTHSALPKQKTAIGRVARMRVDRP